MSFAILGYAEYVRYNKQLTPDPTGAIRNECSQVLWHSNAWEKYHSMVTSYPKAYFPFFYVDLSKREVTCAGFTDEMFPLSHIWHGNYQCSEKIQNAIRFMHVGAKYQEEGSVLVVISSNQEKDITWVSASLKDLASICLYKYALYQQSLKEKLAPKGENVKDSAVNGIALKRKLDKIIE